MANFVFSSFINAWSIGKGLEKLGLKVEYIFEEGGILPKSDLQPQSGDYLFFTEENNLIKYYNSNEYYFYPSDVDKALLDDKFLFAQFLENISEYPVPYESIDTCFKNGISYPVYLKARHSWRNGRKLPRGYILSSDSDLAKVKKLLSEQGISIDNFFYQKLLQSSITNNLSVCGFFDHNSNNSNLIVTRKLLGDSLIIATGTLVETVEGYVGLLERSKSILGKMKYKGPFELEYFYEKKDNKYYVLELNPRFWMQHGIFVDHFDNAIIKNYLGMEDVFTTTDNESRKIVWINSIDLMQAFIDLRFKRIINYLPYYLKFIFRKCSLSVAPNYGLALKVVLKGKASAIKRRAVQWLGG